MAIAPEHWLNVAAEVLTDPRTRLHVHRATEPVATIVALTATNSPLLGRCWIPSAVHTIAGRTCAPAPLGCKKVWKCAFVKLLECALSLAKAACNLRDARSEPQTCRWCWTHSETDSTSSTARQEQVPALVEVGNVIMRAPRCCGHDDPLMLHTEDQSLAVALLKLMGRPR